MTVEQLNPELEALATRIAKATRLKDASVEMRQKHKVAVIVSDGRVLAYVRPGKGEAISVEVAHYGRYERVRCEDVKSAATAVKTSERRKPKQKGSR